MIRRLLAPAKYGCELAREAWSYGVWWFNWHTAKKVRDRDEGEDLGYESVQVDGSP